MKTISQILTELGVTENTTVDELIDLLTLVTVNEKNGIKSISVKPLPTVMRNKADELKDRLTNITIDENYGISAVLDKRIALLYILLKTLNDNKAELNDDEQTIVANIIKANKFTGVGSGDAVKLTTPTIIGDEEGDHWKFTADTVQLKGSSHSIESNSGDASITFDDDVLELYADDKILINTPKTEINSENIVLGEEPQPNDSGISIIGGGGSQYIPSCLKFNRGATGSNPILQLINGVNSILFEALKNGTINFNGYTHFKSSSNDTLYDWIFGIGALVLEKKVGQTTSNPVVITSEYGLVINNDSVEVDPSKYKSKTNTFTVGAKNTKVEFGDAGSYIKFYTNNGSSEDISLNGKAIALMVNVVPKTTKVNGHALTGDVTVTKGDVGLGNVDNTSDLNKPVSNATQNALNQKVSITDIVNNLNSTSATEPLAAYQGKVLKGLIDDINTLLQSDDTTLDQLQEIVDYVKNNKSLIDGITTSKISYTDIIDSLTSPYTNKPLSAKQGYILKGYIDDINNVETGIQAAEAIRVQNEDARILAEQERAAEFATWEDEIGAKADLTNASQVITADKVKVNEIQPNQDGFLLNADTVSFKSYTSQGGSGDYQAGTYQWVQSGADLVLGKNNSDALIALAPIGLVVNTDDMLMNPQTFKSKSSALNIGLYNNEGMHNDLVGTTYASNSITSFVNYNTYSSNKVIVRNDYVRMSYYDFAVVENSVSVEATGIYLGVGETGNHKYLQLSPSTKKMTFGGNEVIDTSNADQLFLNNTERQEIIADIEEVFA